MFKSDKKRIKNLYEITKCLERLNIHHIISGVALLGFTREKSLIKWDGVVEISIRYIDYEKNLIKIIESFEKLKIGRIKINNSYENPKLTINQSNFKYDLKAFHYSKDKKTIFRKMYKYPSKYLDEISTIKIKGFNFFIPKNSEELLELQYGKNWRILSKSKDKKKYLSHLIYTKKNNKFFIISQELIKISRSIFSKPISALRIFLSKYPILEYKMNQYREQLFLDQIAYISKKKSKAILIEIGSSDLKEALILSRINKNINLSVKVYEASRSTYLDLIKIKKYYCLNNIDIFNKAVVPSLSNYQLKKNIYPHLNEMISSNKKFTNNSNNILLSDIKELKIEEVHKLVKMDIEGLEEKLIIENLNFIKNLKNISFTIEMHQSKYNNKLIFEKVINDLLESGYSLLFIELSRGCNDEFKNKKWVISKKAGGRYLVKNPDSSWVKYIVKNDYNLTRNKPYFSSRNIRSITLIKDN